MEYACGNIYLRPNRLVKGEKCEEHMHEFDHTTFFVEGQFRSRRWRKALDENGKEILTNKAVTWLIVSDRVFSAGQWCLIEKDVKHEFECLTETGHFCCIYSHRDPQSGEVVQDYNGWIKAYE